MSHPKQPVRKTERISLTMAKQYGQAPWALAINTLKTMPYQWARIRWVGSTDADEKRASVYAANLKKGILGGKFNERGSVQAMRVYENGIWIIYARVVGGSQPFDSEFGIMREIEWAIPPAEHGSKYERMVAPLLVNPGKKARISGKYDNQNYVNSFKGKLANNAPKHWALLPYQGEFEFWVKNNTIYGIYNGPKIQMRWLGKTYETEFELVKN